MAIGRTPFVFQSTERLLVENTVKLLNELSKDKTYSLDFEDELWYVYEVEDEEDI